jgi:hypothetical protein
MVVRYHEKSFLFSLQSVDIVMETTWLDMLSTRQRTDDSIQNTILQKVARVPVFVDSPQLGHLRLALTSWRHWLSGLEQRSLFHHGTSTFCDKESLSRSWEKRISLKLDFVIGCR